MRTTQSWPIMELVVIGSMTKVDSLHVSIVVWISIL